MSNTALLGSYASQAGTGLTFKNRLINGDMKISQRYGTGNATVAVSTIVYTTDRWFCYSLGATTIASQVSASIAGHTKALKLTPSAGNTYVSASQRIEAVNIEDLAGSVVTYSGWIYVDNATGVTCTLAAYTPNAVDNYASDTVVTISNPTISLNSGAYTYFEKQITLPAAATNGLQVSLAFTGAASKDVRLTGASLEAGPTATPFERRPIGVELALCQRYYEKVFIGGIPCTYIAGGYNNYFGSASFAVVKRVSPTYIAATSSPAVGNYQPGGGTGTAANTWTNTTGFSFSSGLAYNASFPTTWINTTETFLGFSAEL